MITRPIRRTMVSALAGLVLVGVASCSAPAPAPTLAPPAAPSIPAAPPAGLGASAQSKNLVDTVGADAAGLAALGRVGQRRGASDQVKMLGSQLATESQAMLDQLKAAAAAQGVTVEAKPTADLQAVLTDLEARSGLQFDKAWLKAVGEQSQKARDAANAVLNSADSSAEAKAAALQAVAKLEALNALLQKAPTFAR